MSAREEVLTRVRNAIGAGAGESAPVPRDYRAATDDAVDAFIAGLQRYKAETQRVSAAGLDEAVRVTLRDRGIVKVVAPDGIPEQWLEGLEPLRDSPPLDAEVLDGADGAITTCAVAIAQTGTFVLDGTAGMGRRALSLVPDYLLCVVQKEQIVGCLPEAMPRLVPTRPLTFISGPSATVDIEMVVIRGVHGPRRLEVIVAE
jgi:L-lactate dehydrogenase complex protein LldG